MSFYRSKGISKFIDKGKIVSNINISITKQLFPSFLGDTQIQLGSIKKKNGCCKYRSFDPIMFTCSFCIFCVSFYSPLKLFRFAIFLIVIWPVWLVITTILFKKLRLFKKIKELVNGRWMKAREHTYFNVLFTVLQLSRCHLFPAIYFCQSAWMILQVTHLVLCE